MVVDEPQPHLPTENRILQHFELTHSYRQQLCADTEQP